MRPRSPSIAGSAAPRAPVGELCGRWRVVAVAADALGTFCEVEDRQRGARGVARILPLGGWQRRVVARLRDELQAAARLRHEHLLAARELILERDRRRAVAIRPRVAGVSAGELLRAAEGRGVPPQLVLTLLTQLLGALVALHERGLVHGRIHPDSILLAERTAAMLLADPSRDPRLRLVDVGLAGWFGTGAPPAGPWGAPELAGDAGRLSPAADVYAAGAVARALVAGSLSGPLPPLAAGVARLLDALCDRRPTERPTSAAARITARELALAELAAWAESPERRRSSLASRVAARSAARRRAVERRREAVSAARARLRAAVAEGRVAIACLERERLRRQLGPAAAADADLAVAGGWLADQRRAGERRHAAQLRNRRVVLWTTAPLLFALLLSSLIATVLSFSL